MNRSVKTIYVETIDIFPIAINHKPINHIDNFQSISLGEPPRPGTIKPRELLIIGGLLLGWKLPFVGLSL